MKTMNAPERAGFEDWLGMKPYGVAHDLAAEAFQAGAAWQRAQGAVPDVSAMARVLSDRSADACNIDRDDNWAMYGQEYIEDVHAMLAAAPAQPAAHGAWVPEKKVESVRWGYRSLGYAEGWNACVDAMLAAAPTPAAQGAVPAGVTALPDGSAFAVFSYPLPDSHWIYAEREYEGDAVEPKELPRPILTHALRDEVVAAVRYAIRGATNCGKEVDFDPDALVQNAVYALCGPYTAAPAQPAAQDQGEVQRLREALERATKLLSAAAGYATKMEPMPAKLLNAIDATLAASTGQEVK